MSNGLAEFLAERLDVDEERAKRAASVAGPDWYYDHGFTEDGRSTVYVISKDGSPLADMLSRDDEEIAQLIANFDPARVLREVAARRARFAFWLASIEKMDPMLADDDADPVERAVAIGRVQAARELVMIDAAVYSDHPGYRAEWKP